MPRRGRGGLGPGRGEEEANEVVRKVGGSKLSGGDDEVRKTRGTKEYGGDEVKKTRGSKKRGVVDEVKTSETKELGGDDEVKEVRKTRGTKEYGGDDEVKKTGGSKKRGVVDEVKISETKELGGDDEVKKTGGSKKRGVVDEVKTSETKELGGDDEVKEVRKTRGTKELGVVDEVKTSRWEDPGDHDMTVTRTRAPPRQAPEAPEPWQSPDEAGMRASSSSSSSSHRHARIQNKEEIKKEVDMDGTSGDAKKKRAGRKPQGQNKEEDTVMPKKRRKDGATKAERDPEEAPRKGPDRKAAQTEADSPSKLKANVSECPTLGANSSNLPGRGSHKFVGSHMSISGGLWKAVEGSAELGARAFGLFLTSQRTWHTKPLDPCNAQRFRETCERLGFTPDHIVPHGSYLLNCGSPSTETFEKSRAALLSELQRCEQLGLKLYNFHPGSSCGQGSKDACLERIASAINYVHERTSGVVTVIENMCGQGHTVGGQFEELRSIIDLITDQSRIGVCLDTCHAFAAGYDVSSQEGVQRTLDEFHRVVGLGFLKAVHLNDSKGKLGCHLDRHENVGRGHIGLEGFRAIMNAPQLDHLPMILETPVNPSYGYKEEIALLYSLCH